jgi:hypothetical protein
MIFISKKKIFLSLMIFVFAFLISLIRNENKLIDLLERLGLAARAVNNVSKLSPALDTTIDYLRVNQTIEDYATRAGLYLDAALKLGEN